MSRLLKGIAYITYHHHRITLFIVLLLSVTSVYLASHLELRTNFVELLPKDSRTVRVFFESVEDFGMSDFFLIRISHPTRNKTEQMMELADAIADKVKESELVEYVDYRLGDKEKEFYRDVFLRNMTLFMDEEGLHSLKNSLTEQAIENAIQKNRELLQSQVSLAVKKMIVADPLHLVEMAKKYLPGQKGNLAFDLSDGYYISQDQKMLLIMVKPTRPFSNLRYNKKLLSSISLAVKEAARETGLPIAIGPREHEPDKDSLLVDFTGGHVITLADEQVIRRDIIRTVISSFVGIVILFLIAFKRLDTLLLIGFPLIVGVLWTLGFSYLTIGSLNLITSVLSAIIMGLGVDFAIHIYSRFLDECNHGLSLYEAVKMSLTETGKGTLTGALTTAAAFFAMTIAPFRGLAEFGFMAGAGIILCYLAIVIIIPAMIRARKSFYEDTQGIAQLTSFGSNYLGRLSTKFPVFILIFALFVSLLAITQLSKIRFSDSTVDIRAKSNYYLRIRDEIRAKIGGSLRYYLVVLHGKDEKELLAQNAALTNELESLVKDNLLNMVNSIKAYIPPLAQQQRNITFLKQEMMVDVERIRATFQRVIKEKGFRMIPQYTHYLDNLAQSITVSTPFAYQKYEQLGLARILRRFIAHRNGEIRLAIYLFPREHTYEGEPIDQRMVMKRIENAMAKLGIDGDLTGTLPVTQTLKHAIIDSISRVTLIALVVVILILFYHFRDPKLVISSLLPMLIGVLWMLGSMPLVGLNLNFFNIAIIPIIVGIGIDDAVHILHRYKMQGSSQIWEVIHHSGKAVIMTSLTTIVAFGSLYFSDYKGLSAMGYLAITGVTFCLICSLFLLPSLIICWNRNKMKR